MGRRVAGGGSPLFRSPSAGGRLRAGPLLCGVYRTQIPSRIVPAALLALSLDACDIAGPGSDDIDAQAGSYTGQTRFGGVTGTWENGGTHPLGVSVSGQVAISGTLLTGTYDESTASFTWTREQGNTTNGSITFRPTCTSDFYFADLGNQTAGQNFTGPIRLGSDGPLDYQGVLQ